MPRKARLGFEGALYHVMDQGNRLEAIFPDDEDRCLFLKTLGQACERTGWRVHSYVLMGNHYHLLMETPEANLSSGTRWLQATYAIRHNVGHRLRGTCSMGDTRRHDDAEAERLIRAGMECLGLDDLGGQPKRSSVTIALAVAVKSRTFVTNLWIARRLQMGDPSRVSRYCAEAGSREDLQKIRKRREKAGSKTPMAPS